MSNQNNIIRIICNKEDEEKMMQFISKLDFSIKHRHDRGIIILELDLTDGYNTHDLKELLDLQDNLLNLS